MTDAADGQWIALARLDEFPRDGVLVREAGGIPLLLVRDGDAVHVVENRCTHADTRLDTGRIRRCVIRCPLHGARFDLRDGSVVSGPATRSLPVFEARVTDGVVVAAIPRTGSVTPDGRGT
jgi:nitrite reductase/ring-hydroxylating ferredoxin subunit